MAKGRFNYLLYRSHAWLGLISGIFLILICVSGSVAVFRPEIERAFDWDGFDFKVSSRGGQPITIEQAIATAQASAPGSHATAARRPTRGGTWHSHADFYSIVLDRPSGPNVNVLVDPFSANYLRGSVVDFSDALTGGGFKISNPNARQSCGCGKSFEA